MHETKVSIYLGARSYLGEIVLRMSGGAMGLPLSIDRRAPMGKKGAATQLGKYTSDGETAEAKEGMFVKNYNY